MDRSQKITKYHSLERIRIFQSHEAMKKKAICVTIIKLNGVIYIHVQLLSNPKKQIILVT